MAKPKKRSKSGRRSPGRPKGPAGSTAGKAAADRRREAIRRDAQRQERLRRQAIKRRVALAGAMLGGLLAIAAVLVFVHRPTGEEKALLAGAPAAARGAGCDPIRMIRPYPGGDDRTHVGPGSDVRTTPALSSYPSHPPVSGPHSPITQPAGLYGSPPPIDRVIHSLEHASAVIWYSPEAAGDPEVNRIRSFFARGDERSHVIVAPYDYPGQGDAGRLPAGVTMALAAWRHLRLCDRPSLAVAFDFVHAYRFDVYQWTAYRGDAPERWAGI